MSTKTTFKRIALVAVAALGLGLVTSVSAQAANAVTSVTVSAQAPARAGVQSAVAITLGGTFDGSATNVGAKITSAPTGSSTSGITFDSIPQTGDRTYALDAGSQAIYGTVGSPTAATTDTGTASVAFTAGSSTSSGKFVLLFTPHVAGTYQILVWSNATSYSAGLPSAVISITTAGAPVSAVMTTVASTFAASNAATDSKGTIVKVTLKDAAGNATIPNANESVDISASGQATVSTVGIAGDAQSTGEFESYGASSFAYGSIFVAVDNTAAETITLTAAVSGTSTGTLGSIALTTKAANVTVVADDAVAIPSALSTLATANTGGYTAASGTSTSTNLTAQSIQVTITDPAAAAYVGWEIIDTDGYVTGLIGATIHPVSAVASGDTKAYLTVSASLGLLTTSQYTVEPIAGASVAASTGTAIAVTGGTAAAHTMSNGTPNVIRVATGATPVVKARVTNQFGGGVAGAAVTAAISGRNALTTITGALVTDASGYVSFTYTDASTSTTVLTDTITFTATVTGSGSDATGSATVTFGTVTVDDVAVTGAASEDVAPTVTYSNISAAKAGPDGASVAITAEVTDVNGSVLAGVPVTFSISGVAGAAIRKTATTDYTTVYTGTDGTATTYIIGWETGKTTVTATAGEKTGTGAINWRSGTTAANATANARVLSATATGDIVSMKVVDRFGNPVPNTTINLSRVGAGLFGNGASTQDVVTDSLGTADVRFTGSGKVTALLATTYTQAYAAKDFVAGGVATPVAFTAPTAGTTIGTGSTFAPAGVASVTVEIAAGASAAESTSQAAADAAAEATDAANAATDAANAAAEAADAATAAAQDAADAVAALSTQVSEMVNALKKQITALTNLVIKIQKKVKA